MNSKQHYNLFDFRAKHGSQFDIETIKSNYEQNKEYYNKIIYDYIDACLNDIKERLDFENYYYLIKHLYYIKDIKNNENDCFIKDISDENEVLSVYKHNWTINLQVVESIFKTINNNYFLKNTIENEIYETFLVRVEDEEKTCIHCTDFDNDIGSKLYQQIYNIDKLDCGDNDLFLEENKEDFLNDPEFDLTYKDSNGDTILTASCKNDFMTAFELLDYNNININHANSEGDTAFTIACWNNPKLAKQLMERNDVDFNRQNLNGDTGFIIACRNNPNLAEVMIKNDKNIDLEKENKDGETGISILIENQNSLIHYFIQKQIEQEEIDFNKTDDKALERIYKKYVCFNEKNIGYFINNKYFKHKYRDREFNTLFISACFYDTYHVFEIMKLDNVNLNDVKYHYSFKETAFMISIKNDLKIYYELMNNPDIDVNKPNADGDTPFMEACTRYNLNTNNQIYYLTKDNRIDKNAQNVRGDTALTLICKKCYERYNNTILNNKSSKIDINVSKSIIIDYLELIQHLIKENIVDPTIKNNEGYTALDYIINGIVGLYDPENKPYYEKIKINNELLQNNNKKVSKPKDIL